MRMTKVVLLAGSLIVGLTTGVPAGELGAPAAAQRLDQLLAKELYGGDASAAPVKQATDEVFLRRLTLDLVGVPPTPEEITAFALEPAADKRTRAVERLLADPRFGKNWARYWRDVIMYRRTEDRALLAAGTLEEYLTDAFNNNPHWDQIARDFITATGNVQEAGATAIVMAQMGNAEDTTAEVSRIFMGIQIQCAQCHDHPTDRWKREQFHELAAFFPRISVRPVRRRQAAVVRSRIGRQGTQGEEGQRRASRKLGASHARPRASRGRRQADAAGIFRHRTEARAGAGRRRSPRQRGRLDHRSRESLVRQSVRQSRLVGNGGPRLLRAGRRHRAGSPMLGPQDARLPGRSICCQQIRREMAVSDDRGDRGVRPRKPVTHRRRIGAVRVGLPAAFARRPVVQRLARRAGNSRAAAARSRWLSQRGQRAATARST